MYYQNEPKSKYANSRKSSPKTMKDGEGAYIINLDECKSIGTNWIALYNIRNNMTYFDSFVVEHIPKKSKTFLATKIYQTSSEISKNILLYWT